MFKYVLPHKCVFSQRGEQPRTLAELNQLSDVTYLDGGLETLALIGTQLDNALISTNNGAALLTGMGGLAPYQNVNMPFRISQKRITLRIRSEAPVHLISTNGQKKCNDLLVVADASGELFLKIETNGGYDVQAIGISANEQAAAHLACSQSLPEGVISLNAVRAARDAWSQSDAGKHLNDFCIDAGCIRLSTLPHIGKNWAWPVMRKVLLSFLSYLVNNQVRHARLVPGCGFLQGSLFQNGTVRIIDQIFLVSNELNNFALDLSQVTSCWVTRFSTVSHLELYSDADRAVAILAPDPNSDIRCWNNLLESLPMA